MTNNLLLNDVARRLGVKPHQITYLITSGQVPEPEVKIPGRRLFAESDVQRLEKFFENNQVRKGRPATGRRSDV